MITQPTVLILGAGASKPYGYPLGSEIRGRILEPFRQNKSSTYGRYRERGFADEEIKEFEIALVASPFDTIDAILTARPSLNGIGRLAIAEVLAPCETLENLFPAKDWYKYFFLRLHLDDPKIHSPPLSIVTFNYDRSLEHYLHFSVEKALEGDILQSAKKKLSQIPIVHVHGQLGAYPDLRYGFHEDAILIEKASKGIRIVSDKELDNSEAFSRAHHMLSGAVNILFLGFGYDETNLNRLRIRDIGPGKNIYGTAFKCDRIGWVVDYFKGSIHLTDGHRPIAAVLPDLPRVI